LLMSFKRKGVTNLALGSWPRQGFARVRAKKGARECGRVWKWTLTLPNELPFWELESQWTLETLESDRKGQNPFPWKILYIIWKLLKCRCPKWARITHLDICNTSYGQKKGRESSDSLTPDHGKSRIDPIPLRSGGVRHVVGKLSTRATTLVQTSSRLEVCTGSYSPTKWQDS
jgi:hypothetical protein